MGQELTGERLTPTKEHKHMTDRQRKLHRQIDTDHDVPKDAIPGDGYAVEDLLNDPRTAEKREQDALDEAAETGETAVINKSTTNCNDPARSARWIKSLASQRPRARSRPSGPTPTKNNDGRYPPNVSR